MTALSNMALVGRYYDEFARRLMRMIEGRLDDRLKQRVDAEDVLQDVFLKAEQRFRDSAEKCLIDQYWWWYRLAWRTLADCYRANAAKQRDLNRDVPLPSHSSMFLGQHLQGSLSTPSTTARKNEEMEQLKAGIDQLDDTLKDALWMRFFDDLSYREMGELMKCSDKTAQSKCADAIARLADGLV